MNFSLVQLTWLSVFGRDNNENRNSLNNAQLIVYIYPNKGSHDLIANYE